MTGKRKTPRHLLSPEDRRLWRHVAAQAEPLAGRDRLRSRADDLLAEEAPPPGPLRREPAPGPRRALAASTSAGRPAAQARPKPPAELTHGSRDGLDRRKADRLRRGKLPIEATLDLHGLRQAEAQRRLERFLAESQAGDRRCVLVVTGKGLHKEDGGVLRQAVPRWLNEAPNRARVLSFDYAQQKHGGTGALYVLLRRRR
jgi:DNA-nicking Smr family endonuclease